MTNMFRSSAATSRAKSSLYGTRKSADVRAENIESLGAEGSAFDVVVHGLRERATLPLVGTHNIYNALAAVAVGLERGIHLSEVAGGAGYAWPADKRGQVVQLGNITVINDCYNSNPKALEAMVDALAAMPAKRRIVVAGEMLELGPAAKKCTAVGPAYRREENGCADRRARPGSANGGGGEGKPECNAEFVATPRRSGRVAGARNPRGRCGPAESIARREAGEGAGKWKLASC